MDSSTSSSRDGIESILRGFQTAPKPTLVPEGFITLRDCLAECFAEHHYSPLSIDYISDYVQQRIHRLRTQSGQHYKSTVKLLVTSTLHGSRGFERAGLKHWIMKTDVSSVSRESGTKISQRRCWMESWLIEVVAKNIQTMSDSEKYVDSRTLAAREEEIRVSNSNLERRDFDDATGCSNSEEFSNSVDDECDDEYDDDEYEDAEEPRRREITKVQRLAIEKMMQHKEPVELEEVFAFVAGEMAKRWPGEAVFDRKQVMMSIRANASTLAANKNLVEISLITKPLSTSPGRAANPIFVQIGSKWALTLFGRHAATGGAEQNKLSFSSYGKAPQGTHGIDLQGNTMEE